MVGLPWVVSMVCWARVSVVSWTVVGVIVGWVVWTIVVVVVVVVVVVATEGCPLLYQRGICVRPGGRPAGRGVL